MGVIVMVGVHISQTAGLIEPAVTFICSDVLSFLVVKESFDGALRGFLEGGFHHFDYGNLAVVGKRFVRVITDDVRDVGLGLLIHILGEFGIYQRSNFAAAVDDETLLDILAVGQYGLNLFGVNILAR